MIFIKEFPNYYCDKKKLYGKGYWMDRKFITINKFKQLTFYKKQYCPF